MPIQLYPVVLCLVYILTLRPLFPCPDHDIIYLGKVTLTGRMHNELLSLTEMTRNEGGG